MNTRATFDAKESSQRAKEYDEKVELGLRTIKKLLAKR